MIRSFRASGIAMTIALGLGATSSAAAPPAKREAPSTQRSELRFRAADDATRRLLQAPDPAEKRRGVARARALESTAAAALLAELVEPNGAARNDPRLALDTARALCRLTDVERARNALVALVSIPGGGKSQAAAPPPRAPFRDEDEEEETEPGEPDAPLVGRSGDEDRWDLTRRTAALAVARAGEEKSLGNLLQAARGGGIGGPAARAAFYAFPPSAPLLGPATSVPIGLGGASPEFLSWLPSLGDLRVHDVLWASTRANDMTVRAAGLVALARARDLRVLPELRRAAAKDASIALRIAATEGLTVLRASEAPALVAELLDDDATADFALHWLPRAPSEAGLRRAAARAKTPIGSNDIRRRAVEALGRTDDALAVRLLLGLATDDVFEREITLALARTPSMAGMLALESLATTSKADPSNGRRTRGALRAYAIRLFERGERSRTLDVLAESLVKSGGPGAEAARAVAFAKTRTARHYALPQTEPALRSLARSASAQAPAAIEALVAGASAESLDDAERWLGSSVESARMAAARGLGHNETPRAGGLLALAYADEPTLRVRTAIVTALAAHVGHGAAIAVALESAATCDPYGPIRDTARNAMRGIARVATPSRTVATLIHDSSQERARAPIGGAVIDAEGNVVPFVFDEDGYAVVLGLSHGPAEARVDLGRSTR